MRPEEEIVSFVATRLRQLRTERGLSLRQLAHRSDITPEMLSRAEGKKRTPALETIARVCSGLSITVAEFFAADKVRQVSAVHVEAIPRVVRQNLGEFPEGGLNARAQGHFLDAIRSIERGMAAQQQGGAQRRRRKPASTKVRSRA